MYSRQKAVRAKFTALASVQTLLAGLRLPNISELSRARRVFVGSVNARRRFLLVLRFTFREKKELRDLAEAVDWRKKQYEETDAVYVSFSNELRLSRLTLLLFVASNKTVFKHANKIYALEITR